MIIYSSSGVYNLSFLENETLMFTKAKLVIWIKWSENEKDRHDWWLMMGTFPILYFQLLLLMKQEKETRQETSYNKALKTIKKDG